MKYLWAGKSDVQSAFPPEKGTSQNNHARPMSTMRNASQPVPILHPGTGITSFSTAIDHRRDKRAGSLGRDEDRLVD